MSRIVIASDHGGLELKTVLMEHILTAHPELELDNLGTDTTDSVDYPDFADRAANTILSGKADLGILICGTGIGISIRANRYKGIRAALAFNEFTAEMAKAHNNANILCLGGRTTDTKTAKTLVDIWLNTDFEGGRHERRVSKLDASHHS